MSEDPTRATQRPPDRVPAHGSVGPTDPRADPVTQPGLRVPGGDGPPTGPVGPPVQDAPTVPVATPPRGSAPVASGQAPEPKLTHSRSGVLWTGLILSALVLLLLLVFILQNGQPVRITFFGASGVLPTGVALLLAAIAGLLLVAIPGALRILQLRRIARRSRRDP